MSTAPRCGYNEKYHQDRLPLLVMSIIWLQH